MRCNNEDKFILDQLVSFEKSSRFRPAIDANAAETDTKPSPKGGTVQFYSETLGALVANCSSWGFAGRVLWVIA